MKKLGITLLAVAFSLPVFAAQTKPADSASTAQSQTAAKSTTAKSKTKSTAKHHKKPVKVNSLTKTQANQPSATK